MNRSVLLDVKSFDNINLIGRVYMNKNVDLAKVLI